MHVYIKLYIYIRVCAKMRYPPLVLAVLAVSMGEMMIDQWIQRYHTEEELMYTQCHRSIDPT